LKLKPTTTSSTNTNPFPVVLKSKVETRKLLLKYAKKFRLLAPKKDKQRAIAKKKNLEKNNAPLTSEDFDSESEEEWATIEIKRRKIIS
jgi:hypothetical protein